LEKPALASHTTTLPAHKKWDNGLTILKRKLQETTEIIGALEHLALRVFFMVEVFLRLFRNR
jgi:hypothetical protein